MQETHKRSFLKMLSWRIVATLVTLVTAYVFTGSAEQATAIALLAAVVLMLVYYFHERAWNRIAWGREKIRAR